MEQNTEPVVYINPKTTQPKSVVLKKLLMSVFMVVIIIIVFVFFYNNYQASRSENKTTDEADDLRKQAFENSKKIGALYNAESAPIRPNSSVVLHETRVDDVISGSLLFTGKKNSGSDGQYIRTYSLDLGGTSSKPSLLFPGLSFSAMTEFIDTKDFKTAFLITPASEESVQEGYRYGVHKINIDTGLQVALQSTKGKNIRNLVWSEPTKMLAVNRLKVQQNSYVDLITMESWEIVVTKPDTDELVTVIGEAFNPLWLPDGQNLLFFKVDGLYSMNIASKEVKRLVEMPKDGIITTTSMMDISADGKYLVWTTAKEGVITIFEVNTTNEITFKELGRVSNATAEFYWPQISPDGTYYAVQAVDKLKNDVDVLRQNPRIEIRPLKGSNVVRSFSLLEFNFDQLFSDDWITKR